jgi:hypothetical protein
MASGALVMDTFQVIGIAPEPVVPSPPIGGVDPTLPPTAFQSITVFDQPVLNDTVTVHQVVAQQQSWVTIHADQNGQPGMILGAEPAGPGETTNIVIPINVDDITVRLHAVLYADLGTQGAFEIPGADTPVFVDGQLVADTFFITGELPIMLPPGGGEISLLTPGVLALGTLSGLLGMAGVATFGRMTAHERGTERQPNANLTNSGGCNLEKRISYK